MRPIVNRTPNGRRGQEVVSTARIPPPAAFPPPSPGGYEIRRVGTRMHRFQRLNIEPDITDAQAEELRQRFLDAQAGDALMVVPDQGVCIVPRRPGWLADDEAWTEQLAAIEADPELAEWFAAQWALAGGAPPALDTSWITTESIGGGPPLWSVLLLVFGLLGTAAVLSWVLS